jgi:HK97 gp10 family phage protein
MAKFRAPSRGARTLAVLGWPALSLALKTLEPKLQRRIATKAVRAAARPVLAKARALCPVGTTGDLKKSLKIKAIPAKNRRSRKHTVGVGVRAGDEPYKGKTFYGSFIEFGAPGHRLWGGAVFPLKPKPFMRPAMDTSKRMVYSVFRVETAKALWDVVRGRKV